MQLEILPGSQGTLYGRSAIGGTIVMTPAKPEFNFNGETLLEVGNHSAVHITATQNLGVSERVALRVAVDYAYNDGFEVTGADSKNDISARLSTILKPIDDLTIYLYALQSLNPVQPPVAGSAAGLSRNDVVIGDQLHGSIRVGAGRCSATVRGGVSKFKGVRGRSITLIETIKIDAAARSAPLCFALRAS
jgi:outer membrane receptor protein involved in Fe transport